MRRHASLLFLLLAAACGPVSDRRGESADAGKTDAGVSFEGEDDAQLCSDGVDNDEDGFEDCADEGCLEFCPPPTLRVATWNVESLETEGSEGWNALVAIVERIDADVLCLQEVQVEESLLLARLASSTGYPHRMQGLARTALAGGLTNACLSRFPFESGSSWGSRDLSGDPLSNDTGRDIVEVRVEAVQNHHWVTLWSVHLKGGFTSADRLRRQVEMTRAGESIRRHQHPEEPRVVLGDFNEELGAPVLGQTIESMPETGFPPSYRLGTDIVFPLRYEPFEVLRQEGFEPVKATLEDSESQATRIPTGRHIDHAFVSGVRVLGALVYDACEDDGVDAPPAGAFLSLSGRPLACELSALAADHRPVVVDLAL